MKETKRAISLEEPSPTIITCFKIKMVCAICKVITPFAYNKQAKLLKESHWCFLLITLCEDINEKHYSLIGVSNQKSL